MRWVKLVLIALALAMAFAVGWVVARSGMGSTATAASLEQREQRFTERMQNVSLVGRFTLAGRANDAANPDRYDIAKVEKVDANNWRFHVRMRYGNIDVTLPVVMPVQWVGDNPMISVSNYAIPSLGTFDAHVVFVGDRYAGTWQHGEYGGHMYGQIEKQ